MSEDIPYYVRFRSPYGIVTTLAKPELRSVETSCESVDLVSSYGNIIRQFTRSKQCDFEVVFHAQENPEDGTLYKLEIEKR